MAAPKKYPDELRARAVRLYRTSSPRPTFRALADQLGVHQEALRNWVRQAERPVAHGRAGRDRHPGARRGSEGEVGRLTHLVLRRRGGTTMVERFGPYELHSLVGRGGMGEVYRAVDTRKSRGVVALKRLPAGLAEDENFHRRFLREAELAARLRDPHVIPIHDYGEIEGQPYLEMRLVDGVDLGTVLAQRGPMPPERAIGVVGQIASALDAAHRDGLVHRDVKPQNVLLHDPGGSSGNGPDFVYLIDFGIAANLMSSARSSSMVSGTVAYMAPERFASGGDHRVDIYALGCLVYETVTGELPFTGDFMQLMAAHAHTDPPAPSARCPGLPQHLDEVTRRAMAKDPDHRFATAGALAAAAQAPARPRATAQPSPSTAPTRPPDRPRRPQQKHVRTHRPPGSGADRAGHRPSDPQVRLTIGDYAGRWFHRVAYSPEGDLMAALFRTGGCVLLDSSTGNPVEEIDDERVFTAVAFSPDGDLLALGTEQGASSDAMLWDTEDWTMFGRAARHDGKITSLAFSSDGRYLASGSVDHNAVVWDIDKDRRALRCPHSAPVWDVAFSPDGRWLATVDNHLRIFDSTARSRWARPARTHPFEGDARCLSYSPDGAHLIAAGTGGSAVVLDLGSGRALATLSVLDEVRGLAHASDGGKWVTAGAGGQLAVWAPSVHAPVGAIALGVEVEAVEPHPDRKQLAVTTADGVIRIIDLGGQP